MAHIKDIPIRVIHDGCSIQTAPEPNRTAVLAVINEIDEKLKAFQATGDESTIDLKWLVRSSKDIAMLRSILGNGEVAAVVTTTGSSEVNETAVPCLWWIVHHDANNQLRGTFLEISEIPALLRADRSSVEQGIARLRSRGSELAAPVRPASTL